MMIRLFNSDTSLTGMYRLTLIFCIFGSTACIDTGGGDDTSGGSTVRGFVTHFDGDKGSGVTVSVSETDLAATTADDGMFVISGVPSGQRSVIFSRGDRSESLQTDVPRNSTMELQNIRVSKNGVEVGNVTTTINEPPPADNMMPSSDPNNSGTTGSTNSSGSNTGGSSSPSGGQDSSNNAGRGPSAGFNGSNSDLQGGGGPSSGSIGSPSPSSGSGQN